MMRDGKYAQRTQAEWDADRAEAKDQATIVEDRKDAEETLRTLRKQAGYPTVKPRGDVLVDGEVPEAPVEEEDTVRPYSDYTNEELSAELEKRGLPHSGNKDELVARLQESDKTEDQA